MKRVLALTITALSLTACTEAMQHSWDKEMQRMHNYDGQNLMEFFALDDFSANTGWKTAEHPYRAKTTEVAAKQTAPNCQQIQWQQRYVQTGGQWQLVKTPVCADPQAAYGH